VLLQLLDDGRLTDSKGRVVDFSNAIVIMTSNLGAQYLLREAEEVAADRAAKRARVDRRVGGGGVGGGGGGMTTSDGGTTSEADLDLTMEFGGSTSGTTLKPETVAKVMATVKGHFAPEFLNRINDVVLFHPLGGVHLRAIVRGQVAEMAKRLEDRDVTVHITDAALDVILHESYNPSFGARPMRRYVDKHLATGLSRLLLTGGLPDHSTVTIDAAAGGKAALADLDHFTFTVAGKAVAGGAGGAAAAEGKRATA